MQRKEDVAAHAADRGYGDGREYDRDVLIAETKHYLGAGVMAMLEAGRRLIHLKEHEEHGNWLPTLEMIGIGQDTAERMMRAAWKFLDGPNSALVRNLPSISSVYELAMLDDDDLAELRAGGTIAGVHLDDVQRMSPSELRRTLRAERQERREREQAQRERLEGKDRRISALEDRLDQARRRARALANPGSIPHDEELSELYGELAQCLFTVHRVGKSAEAALRRLQTIAAERAGEEMEQIAADSPPALPSLADGDAPSVVTVAALKELAGRLLDEMGAAVTAFQDELERPLATERQPLDVQPWERTGAREGAVGDPVDLGLVPDDE